MLFHKLFVANALQAVPMVFRHLTLRVLHHTMMGLAST